MDRYRAGGCVDDVRMRIVAAFHERTFRGTESSRQNKFVEVTEIDGRHRVVLRR